MTDVTEPPEGTDAAKDAAGEDEQRVPYERFQQANKKAREAADRAKALERDLAEMRQAMEDREEKGLPELDQLRKRLDVAEKRAQEAEQRAEQTEHKATRMQRERMVSQAASKLNFIDPDDAARYVDLDDIEDADQAERAVKRVAKAKQHLVKSDDPKLPGRVLENGRTADRDRDGRERPRSPIDPDAEANMLANALKQFTNNWHTVGE